MALPFEGINDLFSSFSLDKILSGDLSLFTWLFSIIIMITIYAVVIYHFYRYIARRDVFKPSERKHSKAIGFLKYFFLFPFVAFLFFIGFSLIFIFLTDSYEIIDVLYVAFAIIVAIRITAYYTEDLSKDVAKMLPFAILGIFLIDSSYFSMESVTERINTLPENINAIIQFLVLIILVEWILRIALNVKRAIFKKKEEKPKVEGQVW
jgi:hypothetical protein